MSRMKPTLFTGAATALITPFSDGKIDYPAMGGLIDLQIDAGISALLVAGTTGEAAALTDAEHEELIRFCAERIDGRVPLIAGCGSNSTAHAEQLCRAACRAGADALLAVTPYYNKTSDRGLLLHYRALAAASSRPLILYNVPSRTGFSMSMPLYRALADEEKIVAVKEASGDLALLDSLCAECGDRLDVYTGNDDRLIPAMKLGASGVISVVSNVLCARTADITRLCLRREWHRAEEKMREIEPHVRALFAEVNPIPVKYTASLKGLCSPEYRLPLCKPSPDLCHRLETLF